MICSSHLTSCYLVLYVLVLDSSTHETFLPGEWPFCFKLQADATATNVDTQSLLYVPSEQIIEVSLVSILEELRNEDRKSYFCVRFLRHQLVFLYNHCFLLSVSSMNCFIALNFK